MATTTKSIARPLVMLRMRGVGMNGLSKRNKTALCMCQPQTEHRCDDQPPISVEGKTENKEENGVRQDAGPHVPRHRPLPPRADRECHQHAEQEWRQAEKETAGVAKRVEQEREPAKRKPRLLMCRIALLNVRQHLRDVPSVIRNKGRAANGPRGYVTALTLPERSRSCHHAERRRQLTKEQGQDGPRNAGERPISCI